jgi:hypothetical protein
MAALFSTVRSLLTYLMLFICARLTQVPQFNLTFTSGLIVPANVTYPSCTYVCCLQSTLAAPDLIALQTLIFGAGSMAASTLGFVSPLLVLAQAHAAVCAVHQTDRPQPRERYSAHDPGAVFALRIVPSANIACQSLLQVHSNGFITGVTSSTGEDTVDAFKGNLNYLKWVQPD